MPLERKALGAKVENGEDDKSGSAVVKNCPEQKKIIYFSD